MTTSTQAVSAELLGHRFRFRTAPGLFSNDRVDDGTRLLLDHLPTSTPQSVLDLGCGYGALGLPVAARHRAARVTLADRDLLAVHTARENVEAAGLPNVTCVGSLGYRDLGVESFDWILCNIPARIGSEAIRYLIGAGPLSAIGELHIVVIRDLGSVVAHIATTEGWPFEVVATGPRHFVYRLGPTARGESDDEAIYRLDQVELSCRGEHLLLERPQDISEDPAHLKDGLPLLLECLPQQPPGRVLIWRGGYGASALTLARRGAQVLAADRDLLAITFTRRNATTAKLQVETRGLLWPRDVGREGFDLAVCESAAPAGDESSEREAAEGAGLLRPGGTLLWLVRTKQAREWLPRLLEGRPLKGSLLATRGTYSVVQVRRRA